MEGTIAGDGEQVESLASLLQAEASKETRFDRHPISVAVDISLLEVDYISADILPGHIPDDVFAEGVTVPGVILGMKESRARRKLLLCFGSNGDRDRSLAHLQCYQSTGWPLFNSFSGLCDAPDATLLKRYDSQSSLLHPAAEERVRGLLKDNWERSEPPTVVTVHVWNVEMDVLDARVARSRDALEQHFKPFCQHAAIVLLTPTKDSSSTVVTVSVADKESAEYLMKQASALSRFGYFKYISRQEAVVEAPILVALREQRRNLDVKVQASEGEDLMTAKLVAEKARSSRLHTSILLRLLHQKKPWHLCFAVKDIHFVEEPTQHVRYKWVNGKIMWKLVVPFSHMYEAHFVMNKYRETVDEILKRCNCEKLFRGQPKLGSDIKGGTEFIVLESSQQDMVYKAKEAIDRLSRKIGKQLLQRRVSFDTIDRQLLMNNKVPSIYLDENYYVHMPSTGYMEWFSLCSAEVKLVVRGEARQLTIRTSQYANLRKANVDVIAAFMDIFMIPNPAGITPFLVKAGHSPVVEEINAHFSLHSNKYDSQPAVLSSGDLKCKAILCTTMVNPPDVEQKLPRALKLILETSRQLKAKSIAVPHSGKVMTAEEWFIMVCELVLCDLEAGGQLETVVLSSPEKSAEQTAEALESALSLLRASKLIQSFTIVQDKPSSWPQRCYVPTTGIILAETHEDLDRAEKDMRNHLKEHLTERTLDSPGIGCHRAAQCWKNCFMDLKIGCLRYSDSHPQQLTLCAPMDRMDEALTLVEALIDDLKPTNDSAVEDDIAGMQGMDTGPAFESLVLHPTLGYDDAMQDDEGELCDKEIQQNHARIRRVRGFICGEYRTGKSSFMRATLEDGFIEGADSTPGVHVERTMVKFDPGKAGVARFQRFLGVAQLYAELAAELLHQKSQQERTASCRAAAPNLADSIFADMSQGSVRPDLLMTHGMCGKPLGLPVPEPVSGQQQLLPLVSQAPYDRHQTSAEEVDMAGSQLNFRRNRTDSILEEFLPAPSTQLKKLASDQRKKNRAKIEAQLKAIRDLPANKPVSRTYFDFWDCGGQMTMTTQQSICLDTTRSFFVLVFDASKDLDEEVTVEIYRQDGGDIKVPPLFKGMTHRDFILMWLAVIAFRQQRNASASKLGQNANIKKTTVFLVGTHIDEVPNQDMDSVTSKIIDEMKKISCKAGSDNLELKGPYFVDNRRIRDAVVKDTKYNQTVKLQEELVETIESVEEEEMPLSWMKLEDALHLWQECKQSSSNSRRHMTFSFFSKLAQYISNDGLASADVEEVLTLFHQLGSVICHDCGDLQDDSLIFLNPEWMLQKFVQLLVYSLQKRPPPDKLWLANDLSIMQEKGIVSPTLLKAMWSDLGESVRKSIMATMCHFDLACRQSPATEPGDEAVTCSDDNDQSYFVPFCLTRDESKADLPTPDDEGDEDGDGQLRLPPLLLKFKTGFFPPPIFSRVAVHCANQFGAGGVSMEHSAMVFPVETEESVHDIRIAWSPYGLKLEVCSSGEEMEVPMACADLLGAVYDCLEKLKNQQGYAGLSWHLAFPCAHETHPKEAQAKPTAMTRLDNWIEIPANWYKKGAKGKCDSCKKLSKVPADVKTYWLRNDRQAKVSSHDGATTSVTSGNSRQANRAQVPTVEQHGTAADFTTMALNSETAGNLPKPLGDTGDLVRQPRNPVFLSISPEGHGMMSGDAAAGVNVHMTFNTITHSNVTLGGDSGNTIVHKMSRPAPVQGASHASLNTAGHYSGPPPIPLVSEAQIAQLWQSTAVQRCAEDIIQCLPTTDHDGVSHFSAADLREMQARSHSRQDLFITALDQWSHGIGREHVDRVREHFTQVPLPQGVTEAIQRALE